MAILTITELERLGTTLTDGQLVAAPKLPGLNEQFLAIGGGSVASTAFTKSTRYLRINCDIACCIAVSNAGDPDPTAVVNQHRLGPNETDFVAVDPGAKIAVIASST